MIANAAEQIEITAQTSDQIPMALKIRNKEIYGVQFHPEAILTENGLDIFRNFIELCQYS